MSALGEESPARLLSTTAPTSVNVNMLTQNFSAGVNDYVTVRLSDGRLGHTAVVSSQRYKHDIKPLATTSEALYALKPVSFRLKKEFDATQALGFSLIAEEVEKVDAALVYRNERPGGKRPLRNGERAA